MGLKLDTTSVGSLSRLRSNRVVIEGVVAIMNGLQNIIKSVHR